jgi:hypothetical protein
MEMLTLLAAIGAALGLVLLAFGWRGRRLDKHPLCARCGFDLFGSRRWETRECPECGANVSGLAVRVGHRQARAGAVYGGLALLTPTMLVITAAAYVQVRGIDLTPRKPSWWLTYELSGADASVDPAFIELAKRFQTKSLADKHIVDVVDYCLDNQGDRGVPWSAGWGAFVEASHAAGKIKEDRWERYAKQAQLVDVQVPSRIWRSSLRDGLPLTVFVKQSRLFAVSFEAPLELSDVRIDGVLIDSPKITSRGVVTSGTIPRGDRERTVTYRAVIRARDVERLPPGSHEMTAVASLSIRADGGEGAELATLRLDTRVPVEITQ